MAKKSIPVEEASVAQIVEFLTVMHGVELTPTQAKHRPGLMLTLQKVEGSATHILVEDTSATPPAVQTAPAAAGYRSVQEFLEFAGRSDLSDEDRLRRDDTRITIVLDRNDEPGGDQPVPVSVNGRNMFINRGEPSSIRFPFYEALRNAKRHVVEQARIGDPPIERTVQAYPFQTIGLATA